MPSSAIAATTAGFNSPAGVLPAERTATRPPAWLSRSAAAIWLRPALWTQTNRTWATSFTLPPHAPGRRPSRPSGPDDRAVHSVADLVRLLDLDRLESPRPPARPGPP